MSSVIFCAVTRKPRKSDIDEVLSTTEIKPDGRFKDPVKIRADIAEKTAAMESTIARWAGMSELEEIVISAHNIHARTEDHRLSEYEDASDFYEEVQSLLKYADDNDVRYQIVGVDIRNVSKCIAFEAAKAGIPLPSNFWYGGGAQRLELFDLLPVSDPVYAKKALALLGVSEKLISDATTPDKEVELAKYIARTTGILI